MLDMLLVIQLIFILQILNGVQLLVEALHSHICNCGMLIMMEEHLLMIFMHLVSGCDKYLAVIGIYA